MEDDCKICKGTGKDIIKIELVDPCHFCSGHGKINWLEKVVGVEKNEYERASYENNMTMLIHYLKLYAKRLGMDVSIQLKLIPPGDMKQENVITDLSKFKFTQGE